MDQLALRRRGTKIRSVKLGEKERNNDGASILDEYQNHGLIE